MTHATADKVTEAVDALQTRAAAALNLEDVTEFEVLESQLAALEANLRETQQEMWSNEAQAALRNLDAGNALTPEDQNVIRTFLISDAEHYVAIENNFQDWIDELNRLFDDINKRAGNFDRNSIGELRAVVKDAMRLVPDIRNYIDEKQRVEKFNVALHSMDDQSRGLLARVLKQQITSDNR